MKKEIALLVVLVQVATFLAMFAFAIMHLVTFKSGYYGFLTIPWFFCAACGGNVIDENA